jgi:integrase
MGRRARGEGSVFKRWDKRLNRYQWMVQITLEDGQQKQYRVKNQEEGVKLLKKLQRDLEQGTLVTGPKQTIKQYLEYWLEEVHRSSIKVSTYVKYRKVINGYIIPALGHLTLEKLTPQHVKSLYNKKEKEGLAPKTIHSIHGVLHKALDNAVLWNMVARNVCNVVKPPRLVKKERQSLTMDQAHTLLESVRGQRLEMLLTLALVTGMRRGELLALRWSDVDMDARLLRVNRTVDYIPGFGYVVDEQKTAAGRRAIVLPLFVVEMLKYHRVEQLEARLKAGGSWEDLDLVITDLHGGYFNPRYLEKTFSKLITDAGLPRISFHNLRHSAATLLRGMGIDIKLIQEILGHSNFATTADIYSHVLPSMRKEAANKWDDEFRDNGLGGVGVE